MSDYLDNLIARSLGTAETVQPRPVSLFEPLQSTVSVSDQSQLEEIQTRAEIPRDSEVTTGQSRQSQTPEPSVQRNDPADSSQTPDWEVARPSVTLLTPHSTMIPELVEVDSIRGAELSDDSELRDRTIKPEDTMTDGAPPAANSEIEDNHAQVFKGIGEIAREVPQRSGKEAARGSYSADVTLGIEQRTLLVSPVIVRESRERLLPGTTPNRAPSPETAARLRSETPPSIRITIGRVDVRAVTSEPKPLPAPERRPSLSLDDYLRQRSGGKP